MAPARFDPAIPQNAAKLDLVERLVEVADGIGCSLPELAIAFPVVHPAVTSVIIGPRTMDQLDGLLAGASVALGDETLDLIDEIVPPGVNQYHPDGAWTPPVLVDPSLRRRPIAERTAG